MRGISNKVKVKAELVAAGRIAFIESLFTIPYPEFPYKSYGPVKTPQIWRLSEDIVDAYEDDF